MWYWIENNVNQYSSNHEVVNPEIFFTYELPEEYVVLKVDVEHAYVLTKSSKYSQFRSVLKSW